MKKTLYGFCLFLAVATPAHTAPIQGDVDNNVALDLNRGGTNATTAPAARANLGVPSIAQALSGIGCTAGPCFDGSADGGTEIRLRSPVAATYTAIQGGESATGVLIRLPVTMVGAGTTRLVYSDEYGNWGWMDPATVGRSNGTAIAFDDTDNLWTATTLSGALEELNDSINAGAPNGTGAKVHWSQITGVPAGFADGTDDGGGSATPAASDVTFTPNGSIAATSVQAAIQEVRDEAGGATDETIATSDVTTNNASTSKHGFAVKATAPSVGGINVMGIANGETAYSNKSLFDSTDPTTQAFGDAAAVGSATTTARRDHKHAMPATPGASAITVTATGFNGNLATDDDTVQKVAQKLDDLVVGSAVTDETISTTDVTTNNASTSKHGWLLKATAPAAGLTSVPGISNGETAYTLKPLFDATVPSTQAYGDSAAVGSATVTARRDHKHAMPAAVTDATIAQTDVTTGNANTTNHGWLLKATAPASGLRNIVGIDNAETAYTNKALFDATSPSTQALGDSAAVGSAMTAARRDHKHAMPAVPVASAITVTASGFDGNLATGDDTVQKVAQKLDDLVIGSAVTDATITSTDVTTNNASTTKHGWLLKATAPAAGLVNFVGIANGETSYTNRALFDATVPAALTSGGSSATGSSTVAARRDHVHTLPSIPVVSDTAYNATSWDGNTDAPSKNAVRDVLNSLGAGFDPASPGAIGGTTPADGTFTTVTAASFASTAADGSRYSTLPNNTSAPGTGSVVNGFYTYNSELYGVEGSNAGSKVLMANDIGGTVQGYDADLTTWAGVTSSANGRSLVSAADYSTMRTLLSLAPGTNVQAYDADLTTWAGVTPGTGVAIALGNNVNGAGGVMGYDADLVTWAGITPGTGIDTFLATPSGANLASALTSALPATKGGTGLTSLGTGVATAMGNATGGTNGLVTYSGAMGTPSAINLTNAILNSGTSLPGTCTVGQVFQDTDADTDGDVYFCRATNTWKAIDDDGGAGGLASADIDTSAELVTIVTDETGSATGTPKLVFNQAPRLDNIELGADTDTTIARSGAGSITVEGVPVTLTVVSGTSALGTAAISSGACASVVTTTATGTATTDVINWGFNGDPTGVTGYAPSANGMLTIIAYPSSGNVNYKVCNNTAASVTPGAITLNWRILR